MLGIGTDILQIDRIAAVVERRGQKFAARILAPGELLEYSQHPQAIRFLAKRFAAKEAIGKALGTGIGQGVSWQDIRIDHDDIGAPKVSLGGRALEVARDAGGDAVLISISDEQDYVLAFACLVAARTSP